MSATGIPGYVAGTWDLDPVHSHIGFEARHLVVSKVRGRFEKFTGQIVTAQDPLRSSATLTAQINSVTTGNKTRDDDLHSDDFFGADARATGQRAWDWEAYKRTYRSASRWHQRYHARKQQIQADPDTRDSGAGFRGKRHCQRARRPGEHGRQDRPYRPPRHQSAPRGR